MHFSFHSTNNKMQMDRKLPPFRHMTYMRKRLNFVHHTTAISRIKYRVPPCRHHNDGYINNESNRFLSFVLCFALFLLPQSRSFPFNAMSNTYPHKSLAVICLSALFFKWFTLFISINICYNGRIQNWFEFAKISLTLSLSCSFCLIFLWFPFTLSFKIGIVIKMQPSHQTLKQIYTIACLYGGNAQGYQTKNNFKHSIFFYCWRCCCCCCCWAGCLN